MLLIKNMNVFRRLKVQCHQLFLFACVFYWVLRNASSSWLTPTQHASNSVVQPRFDEAIENVTVPVGRNTKLACVVSNLGNYRVAWLRVESKTILSIHHNVITRNYRISLSHSDNKNFVLHINDVQESDRGGYMCQINTEPMKSQVGFLDVVVPPDIIVSESSSDVMVREGSNVTLVCKAKGYPIPKITWRREDGFPIAVGNWQSNRIQDLEYEGEDLYIAKVSRIHMGAYLCIASNKVPPSVSRRVLLQVHFPPMIWIPNQLVGASLGGEVTLECHTEAFPLPINYWTKEEGDMIISGEKFQTSFGDKSYKVDMKLTINNLEPQDYGTYRCFAKNSLGATEGTIKLYEIHAPSKPIKEPSTAKIQSYNVERNKKIVKQSEPHSRQSTSRDYEKNQLDNSASDEMPTHNPIFSRNSGSKSSKAFQACAIFVLCVTSIMLAGS